MLKPLTSLLSIVVLAAPCLAGDPPKTEPAAPPTVAPADPTWLDRMDKDDRAALEQLLGYAPPAMVSDLKWIGTDPINFNDLRGRVIVIQSFTTANSRGASYPARLKKSLGDVPAKDLFIIALHTPEGADKAVPFLAKKPPEVPVLIDPSGTFSDSLFIYKEPANLIIDRNGTVRFVGLNDKGLAKAVELLVQEKFDLAKAATPRPIDPIATTAKTEFPPIEGKLNSVADVRGKPAPTFFVQEWLTKEPSISNRVVVIDFWATWCPPCRSAIPHMNDLATKYGDKAAFIGLSDEKEADFEAGMKKYKLSLDSFKYSLALDPSAKMKKSIKVAGIPNIMIVSSDGIVRWQGHPTDLTASLVDKIIKADESLRAGGSGSGGGAKSGGKPRPTWTGA